MSKELKEGKSVGGTIPSDLYWEFKRVQAQRQETSTKALEVAIRLYCDAIPEINEAKEGRHGGNQL